MKSWKFALLGICLTPIWAAAQGLSGPFERLRETGAVDTGAYVRVVDHEGVSLRGMVESISGEVLRLRVGREVREIGAGSVRQVFRRRPADDTWNGVLIGLGAGVGTGIGFARSSCTLPDRECLAITTLVFVPAFAAAGSLVGYVVDRAIRGYDSVYEASPDSEGVRARVSPLIGRDSAGLHVVLSF